MTNNTFCSAPIKIVVSGGGGGVVVLCQFGFDPPRLTQISFAIDAIGNPILVGVATNRRKVIYFLGI